MASKNYYLHIILGTLVIVATALGLGIVYSESGKHYTSLVLLLLLISEIVLFIFSLNSINRKIASFFNAIQNEDTSIFLPENSKNKSVREIQQAMNRVIQVFQKIKMENEIRQQFFSAMIEHSSTGFISIDEHGDFEIMNETARKLLGVAYTSNMERLQKESPQLYKTLINLRHGEVKSCPIVAAGMPAIVQVSSSYLGFKDKKLTLISIQNIKKEIESRELESWQKLIRILNHEIMNSIAPITSVSKSMISIFKKNNSTIHFAELDEKKIGDVLNGLEVIESMSSGLSKFVTHYRELSKIPEPVFNDIDTKSWSEKLATINKDCIAKNNASLEISIHPACSTLKGDESLLTRVFINLLKNATEAPINDGKKQITIDFQPAEKNQTLIKVSNNGEIIPVEILDQIFVPFFTTKESGAGIGLFISRQIINLHQGTISVTSDKTKGTVFSIEL